MAGRREEGGVSGGGGAGGSEERAGEGRDLAAAFPANILIF